MNRWVVATIAGVGIGMVYALSPLTVWFAVAMWALHRYATSGFDADERQWLTVVLVLAVVLRIAAVAGLFAITNHSQVAFGTFFGDEEFYIRRSIWLRNVALHVPIHSADLIYAYDDSGWTSHLYVLSFFQVLVGPSPYGVHLIGVTLYLFGAFMLFRLIRRAFGRVPSMLALLLVLFLPSFFTWSITALKEPLYFLMTVSCISLALTLVRDPRWIVKLVALATLGAMIAALGTIREGGAVLVGGGILCGLLAGWIVRRPKVVVAMAIALPIVIGVALESPKRQIQVYNVIQRAAHQHWGHVQTPGWTYKLLDEHYYQDSSAIDNLEFRDAAQFVVRAIERYVTVPWPWEAQSAAALAYMPEQLVWYLVVALLPIGLVFSLRRDALLTGVLAGVGLVAALTIALISGNVGTLVRLRVLAFPYLATLSAVGACELLALAARRTDGRVFEKAEPIWH